MKDKQACGQAGSVLCDKEAERQRDLGRAAGAPETTKGSGSGATCQRAVFMCVCVCVRRAGACCPASRCHLLPAWLVAVWDAWTRFPAKGGEYREVRVPAVWADGQIDRHAGCRHAVGCFIRRRLWRRRDVSADLRCGACSLFGSPLSEPEHLISLLLSGDVWTRHRRSKKDRGMEGRQADRHDALCSMK